MRYTRFLALLGTLMATALLLAAVPGCEDDPEGTDVDQYFDDNAQAGGDRVGTEKVLTVSPASAQVTHEKQQVSFHALGGPSSYRWTVANGNGTLAVSKQTDTATYTVAKLGPNTVRVTDSRGHSAAVPITVTPSRTLQIVPSVFTFTNADPGDTINFRVLGGSPPYRDWRSTVPAMGTVAGQGPDFDTAVYTVVQNGGLMGLNTVSVRDSAGNVASVQVTHTQSN